MAEAKNSGSDDVAEGFNEFRDEIDSLADLNGEEFNQGVIAMLQDLVDIQEDTLMRLMRLEDHIDTRIGMLETLIEDLIKITRQPKRSCVV